MVATLEARADELAREVDVAQQAQEGAEREVAFVRGELQRMREEHGTNTRQAEEAREELEEMAFKCDELQVELEESASRAEAAVREKQEALGALQKEREEADAARLALQEATSKIDVLEQVRDSIVEPVQKSVGGEARRGGKPVKERGGGCERQGR